MLGRHWRSWLFGDREERYYLEDRGDEEYPKAYEDDQCGRSD